jgi:hypothetical protein
LLPSVRRPYFGTCGLTNRSPGAASSYSIRKVGCVRRRLQSSRVRLRREAGEFCRGGKRRTPRLRNVVSTCMPPSAEISEQAFCREARLKCGGFGTAVLPNVRRPRSNESASAVFCREGEPPKEVKLPRRRPTHSRSRREAGCLARRPSRLNQRKTDGVTPLASAPAQETSLVAASGAPRPSLLE